MNSEGQRSQVKGHKSGQRRAFIKTATATAAGALLSGLPSGWVGGVYADDGAVTTPRCCVIVRRADRATICMERELGYFKKFGIKSVIPREAPGARIRDK